MTPKRLVRLYLDEADAACLENLRRRLRNTAQYSSAPELVTISQAIRYAIRCVNVSPSM